MNGLPIGDIPISLLSRQGTDGSTLSWTATYVRLHVGMSWTEEGGEGSMRLLSGWEAFCRSLAITARTAIRLKQDLLAHGGLRVSGKLCQVDRGSCGARSVHRGLCRLLKDRLLETTDGRCDPIAAAVLIAIDLYSRAKADGHLAIGEVYIEDLAAYWHTDAATISHALARLRNHGLMSSSRRHGGRGRGQSALRYAIEFPDLWRGYSPPAPTTPAIGDNGYQPAADASLTAAAACPVAFTMRLGFCHPTGAKLPSASAMHSGFWHPLGANIPPEPGHTPAAGAKNPGDTGAEVPNPRPQRVRGPTADPMHAGFWRTSQTAGATASGFLAPQEMHGDLEKRGETATLPPIPPDHQAQVAVPAAHLWPDLEVLVNRLQTAGVRLPLNPLLADALGGLDADQVIAATHGQRIEDPWDLRVVLYRARVLKSVGRLWHDDIDATLREASPDVHRCCLRDVEARDQWMSLLARHGMRLTGVLTSLGHLLPRDEPPRVQGVEAGFYARLFDSALRQWVQAAATEVHLVTPPPKRSTMPRTAPPRLEIKFPHLAGEAAAIWEQVATGLIQRAGFADDVARWRQLMPEFAELATACAVVKDTVVVTLGAGGADWVARLGLHDRDITDMYRRRSGHRTAVLSFACTADSAGLVRSPT